MPILDSRPLSAPEDVRVLADALGRRPGTIARAPLHAQAMREAAARARADRRESPEARSETPRSESPRHSEPAYD